MNRVINADCRDAMRLLIAEGVRVQTIVTSPPYYGLRNYGLSPSVWGGDPSCAHEWGSVQRTPWANAVKGSNSQGKNGGDYANAVKEHGQWCQHCNAWLGCFGLEPDYRMYVAHSVEIFDLARQLLADDGVLWLNLGDSYATGAGKAASPGGGAQGEKFLDIGPAGYRGAHAESPKHAGGSQVPDAKNPGAGIPLYQPNRMPQPGLKPKDLMGIPWRVAFALQDAGWWLRQDIIWSKPNPMPESVRDRCTKAHEYLFLMAKSERYFYDAEAMKEDAVRGHAGSDFRKGKTAIHQENRTSQAERADDGKRNRRSVWTVATKPYNGKKALTDYVGDDGKPYTASPDCPIHGHLARRQTSGTHGYGGQQGQSQTGSAGTCAHHAQSPACGEQSTTSHISQASGAGNSRQHTPESSHENKTDARLSGHTLGDGNQSCSGCKSASGEHQDCGKDCSHQSSSSTATSHNTGTSKTARAPATIRPCMPCAETDNRTQSTSDQRGLFEQDHGISESSILTGETFVHPLQDTRICNAGTSSELVSMAYEVGKKCTCNEVIIDHFATFPPALIEPCILAGSRPGDIVFDPFMGSGTVASVAQRLGRRWVGSELNPEYVKLIEERTRGTLGMELA